MNWLDAVLLAMFALAVLGGLRRGLFVHLIELSTLVAALVVSLRYYQLLGDWLVLRYGVAPLLAKPLAFLGMWILIEVATAALLELGYRFVPEPVKHSPLNRLLGIVPALLKTSIYLGLGLAILLVLPLPTQFTTALKTSPTATTLVSRTGFLKTWLEHQLGGTFEEAFTFVTIVHPDESRSIRPVTDDTKLRAEPGFEDQILKLVNDERQRAGLHPLVMDEKIRAAARAHSRDMWRRGYFAHENPDGLDPFDRLTASGITFRVAGENLALAPSVEIAHAGLMRSPSHRENILFPDFGRVGIGIMSAGADGIMVTQDFVD